VVAQEGAGARASTMAFVTIVLIHPLQALHCRSDRVAWWRLPANPLVWVSLVALVAAQWGAITWSPLARLLDTVALSPGDWLVAGLAVLWPVVVLEGVKAWRARTGLTGASGPPRGR
jgi:magnesium-transporting ATPase (P-type)